MIFTSIEFFIFIAVVFGLLATLRGEGSRRWLLLGTSYFFYGWWDWRFCSISIRLPSLPMVRHAVSPRGVVAASTVNR